MPPPDDYYLGKLEHMFAWVRRHHGDLVDEELARWIDAFERLPRAARRLFVRLLQRRGPDFRVDLLCYAEVPDPPLAALALVLGGFARIESAPCARLASLRVPELRRIALGLNVPRAFTLRRNELLAILEAHLEPRPPDALPVLVRLEYGDALAYLRLLYFGSLRQDLTEFILADIGMLNWPRVALSPHLPFRNAGEVRAALATHRLADLVSNIHHEALSGDADLRDAIPTDQLDALVAALASPGPCAHTEARRGRALQRLADWLYARGERRRALRALRHARTPAARERMCRMLARHGRRASAERLRQHMLASSEDVQERRFAERFDVVRGRCRARRRHAGSIAFRRLLLPAPRAGERVEARVAAHFCASGNRVLHMENHLPGMLFALGFWDIVFAPLPGAFVQPFQAGPLDLDTSDFRARRRRAIDARLSAIADDRHGVEAFMAVLARERDRINAFWGWSPPEVAAARALLTSIPPQVRAGICDRIASEPGRARSGFPDLTIGNGVPGCYAFVEVKGPGDALRDGQRRWLEDLHEMGAHAEVLEVRWA